MASAAYGLFAGTTDGFKCNAQPACVQDKTFLKGATSTAKGTCAECSNVNCPTNQYRTGVCTTGKNEFECNTCKNMACLEGQVRTGTCSGTSNGFGCQQCKNADCDEGTYRAGTCSGANDGYTCTPQPECVGKQYLDGASATKKGTCKDQPTCQEGEQLTGNTTTTKGVCPKCKDGEYTPGGGVCTPCQSMKCPAGKEYLTGQCAGNTDTAKCAACRNIACAKDKFRTGSCSRRKNGFRCTPQPTCKEGEYLANPTDTAAGACTKCASIECGDGQYRAGTCAGTSNGCTCEDQPTCEESKTYLKGATSQNIGKCTKCSNLSCKNKPNHYRAGACNGANNGFRCKAHPTCAAYEYLDGSSDLAEGTCVGCDNISCTYCLYSHPRLPCIMLPPAPSAL